MTAGSGFIVHKFRQIKIGKTDLHHYFFLQNHKQKRYFLLYQIL